jgi:acetolactate synthase-1/2/3 large subunit
VLALPEDMLLDEVDVPDSPPYRQVHTHPGAEELRRLRELLAASERPLVIAGGGKWSAQAAEDLAALCEANDLPVATSFRRQDYVDNRSRVFVGHVGVGIDPALATRVAGADLLLVVGPRLGEMTTGGYTLVEPPQPRQTLVHVHAGAEELGRVYQPELAIHAGSPEFAAAAREACVPGTQSPARAAWLAAAREEYLRTLEPVPAPGALNLSEATALLQERLPEDTIVCNGAGNFATWPHRFWQYTRYRSQLAPTSGAMGYGVPAAIAAKIVHPDRTVVCFAGDGDFLMSGQELATAAREGAAVLFLVVDNGMYGTIRMHQEREYPGRVTGTALTNPDFAAYAASFGAHAERVERTEEVAPALERALAAGGPALLHLVVDPDAIAPNRTLTEVRQGTGALERTETA